MTDVHRIVVLGAARSGTKLLRDTLALATGAGRVPYDINYVWRMGNEHRRDEAISPDEVNERSRRFIRRFVDRYAAGDPPTVIEKTVGNCLRLPAVAAVLPNATFIHLVRDGVDVVESTHRQWGAPTDLGYLLGKLAHFPPRLAPRYGGKYLRSLFHRRLSGSRRVASWGPRYPGIDTDLEREDLLVVCARQWRESVGRVRSDAARLGIPLIEVRYERLIDDPELELSKLAAAAGLRCAPDRLADAVTRFTVGRAGTGRRTLSAADLAVLDREIGPLLKLIGYHRTGGPASVAADTRKDQ